MIIKAAKRIFNSDKICRSYSDLNFGVTFFGTQCIFIMNSTEKKTEKGITINYNLQTQSVIDLTKSPSESTITDADQL